MPWLKSYLSILGIHAIATEARRAATTGSVEDEGAGLQGIAQPPSSES
jgi:hypothetical protein